MSTCDPASMADIAESVAEYVTAMLAHPGALRGQQLRGGGPVADFEMLLAEQTGFPHCLATSSATNALLVAGLALELAGKRIAVETGAWEGSLGALEAAGADILEVDSLSTFPVDGLRAVVATNKPGHRHDAAGLRARCDQTGVIYIEDTGWLPGITAPVGQLSLADIQIISFGPGKPLSLGEGGALLCRDKNIYDRALALSQHPERAIAEGVPCIERPPLNARIHPLAALLGISLLSHKPEAPIERDSPGPGAAQCLANIVCLCGSSRWPELHHKVIMEETLAGNIVIPLGLYGHADHPAGARAATNDGDESTVMKQMLDRLHFQKINLANEIVVVTKDGYIGDSTRREIEHALVTGKRVRYWPNRQI